MQLELVSLRVEPCTSTLCWSKRAAVTADYYIKHDGPASTTNAKHAIPRISTARTNCVVSWICIIVPLQASENRSCGLADTCTAEQFMVVSRLVLSMRTIGYLNSGGQRMLADEAFSLHPVSCCR